MRVIISMFNRRPSLLDHNVDAQFLSGFANGALRGRFVTLDLAAGQFPEAGQDRVVAPACDEQRGPAAADLDDRRQGHIDRVGSPW